MTAKNAKYRNLEKKLVRLKQGCPLPQVLQKLGLGKHARPSCPSPFRKDQKPSWGIFKAGGCWFFKDHATGEGGNVVKFLAKYKKWDHKKDFAKIVDYYEKVSKFDAPVQIDGPLSSTKPAAKPDMTGFNPGTSIQLKKLSQLRHISLYALQILTYWKYLVFGTFAGHEVYGLKDKSGRILELRRLDGEDFPAFENLPARKCHTVKGSRKNWPLGIREAEKNKRVMLVEGLPDFLAACDFVVREQKLGLTIFVAMLTASCRIDESALAGFKGKQVTIYAHADSAGKKAAAKWRKQLIKAGAAKVDVFNFAKYPNIKDLCDLNVLAVRKPDVVKGGILK